MASVLIDCGGPAYTDSLGQVWSADKYFVGGTTQTYTHTVSGTADTALYQSERFAPTLTYNVPVPNGNYEVTFDFAEMYFTAAGKRVFSISLQGQTVLQNFDIWAVAGQYAAVQRTFAVAVTNGVLNIVATASVNNATFSAIQIIQKTGDLYLHPIATVPSYVVNYNGTGSVVVPLIGDASHTHQPGHNLKTWTWTEGTTVLGTAADFNVSFPIGTHAVTLTITDDNTPPRTASVSATFTVCPISAVPGVLTSYDPAANSATATQMIDALPSAPGFQEVLPSAQITNVAGKMGGLTSVVAVMDGKLRVPTAATYLFTLTGSNTTRFFVNGSRVSAATSLAAGTYTIQARFVLDTTSILPASVLASIKSGPTIPLDPSTLTHDESNLKPFINSNVPTSGSPLGGDSVRISGIGFFPSNSITVHWGNTNLTGAKITSTPTSIQLVTPPGSGNVAVTVQTPKGTSNSVSYNYIQGVVPISFTAPTTVATVTSPTCAAWGPDGRLYVGSTAGNTTIYTFADDYTVTNAQVVTTIAGLSNPSILGITFNPRDPPSPVKMYVAHSQLYAEGGGSFTGPAPYNGQVSVLTGPTFSTVKPLITGLPVSNRDHAINGMQIDDAGNLLICSGSMTNAGIPSIPMGTLPNSPLDASILKALITKTNFNGAITYVETATGKPNNDQVYGDRVDVAAGVDVSVFAPGMRNPFDIVWATNGKLYGTDNGMNANFGDVSTSATTQIPPSDVPDKINYIVQGNYYGSPNRNRGRYDARQNVYHFPTDPTTSSYASPMATIPSSTDGIDEYRATTFNSQMRGNLLAQHWKGSLYRGVLSTNGQSLQSVTALASTLGLGVVAGPGGAILSMDYSNNKLVVIKPIDSAATSMVAYDIFPWRGRADGTVPFVIGGAGFGTLSGTTVTIGGTQATLTSVSATRIKGFIPANAAPSTLLLDVVVQSGGKQATIPQAFRYN